MTSNTGANLDDPHTADRAVVAGIHAEPTWVLNHVYMAAMSGIDYAAFVRGARDAIIVADARGQIVEINPAAEEMLGWTHTELEGQPLTVVMPERYREAHTRGLARLLATGVATLIGRTVQVEALHRDGNEVPVELALAQLRGPGGALQFAAVIRDLGQVRRLEDAVREARLRAEQLAEAVRMREEFLSLASHEMRTPVTVLRMQARLAAQQGLAGEPLARMQRQIDRLDRLMARMLNTARIESGRLALNPEVFDLAALVRQVAGDFAVLAPGHQIAVDVSETALIRADRECIEQVLFNLIENAVKYSPEPRPIIVQVRIADGRIRCRVADQGIGVPADLRERLFSRFVRERSERVRSISGLGVGLYICRGIIEAHGGTIGVESELGCGAVFTFDLPQNLSAELGVDGQPVLVVDDDVDLRAMFQLTLGAAAIPCEGARDGIEALEAMRRRRPSLVLLDLMMPRMDGWECYRQMQADARLRDVPVVVMSGNGDVKRKAAELGVPEAFGKPFDVDVVLAMIRRYLSPRS